jgi:hypothetical protein
MTKTAFCETDSRKNFLLRPIKNIKKSDFIQMSMKLVDKHGKEHTIDLESDRYISGSDLKKASLTYRNSPVLKDVVYLIRASQTPPSPSRPSATLMATRASSNTEDIGLRNWQKNPLF